jgi:hypothetical protein
MLTIGHACWVIDTVEPLPPQAVANGHALETQPESATAADGFRYSSANIYGFTPTLTSVAAPLGALFAVGNRVTPVPPHRSERAGFPHSAPTSGV